ncbi:MAG: nucleotidyltransferase [Faecalibacterium sp.]
MNKPVLVVMAAGMGSRYGGMKQIDPVGPGGQVIMEYSLYDAHRAGFDTVIFVIKREIEQAFRAAIGERAAQVMEVRYAFQQLEDLPEGIAVPQGRVKPWGTCHAILAARRLIDGPFAVINADDYYGPQAFRVMYDYLSTHTDGAVYDYCMVSYLLSNTVSEHGSVSRGVCAANPDGTLASVTERTRIEKYDGGIHYTEDGGESWIDLDGNTPVSMNLWGFGRSFVDEAEARFGPWLEENLAKDPLKCEYFLPSVASGLIAEGKAKVTLLHSPDKWYGVTYREDKPVVMEALARMTAEGVYPAQRWGGQG